MDYDLEIGRIVKTIKETKAKRVIIQLPEGLKPLATRIVDEVERVTEVKPHIFLGTNFGACDIPQHLNEKYDLLVHFGHSRWV